MNWFDGQRQQLLNVYRDEAFLRYLRDTAIAFLVLIVGSFVVGLFAPTIPVKIVSQFNQAVADAGIADESGKYSALPIFIHNLQAALSAILYGFIPFLFLPALALGTNSMLLGFVGAHYVNNGQSFLLYLAAILPHGIFELPALVLAMACGLFLCSRVTHRIRAGEKGVVRLAIHQILRIILWQILPLLFIAALVETYLTTAILNILA